MKRKSDPQDTPEAPELSLEQGENEAFKRKLTVLAIENLITFNLHDDSHLTRLICHLSGKSAVEIPTTNAMLYHVNEMYNSYQSYLKNYFSKFDNRTYSLTLHKWDHKDQFIFFHVQYMDEDFNFHQLPLGLFKTDDFSDNIDLGLIRNAILHDLTGKIGFITTNFELDNKAKNILSFVFGENKENIGAEESALNLDISVNHDNKILMCFDTFVIGSFYQFLKGLGKYPELDRIFSHNSSSQEKVEALFEYVVSESSGAVKDLEYDTVKGSLRDLDGNCKYFLAEFKSGSVILSLRALVNLKPKLSDTIVNLITPYQWQLLEFISYISAITFKLVKQDARMPTAQLLLQYVKYQLFLFNHMFEKFPTKYNLLSRGIYKLFEEFFVKIDNYHKELVTKTNIQIATYLSPSTRKFLKASEIQSIRSSFFQKPKAISKDVTLMDDESSNYLDNIVMDTFECSGNLNNECFLFESMSAKTADLTSFWKEHKSDFPMLAKVAKKILPIRTCSDRGLANFKNHFDTICSIIKKSDKICSIEAFYFIFSLSREIDIIAMDENDYELNIEDFQHPHLKARKFDRDGMVSRITSKDMRLPSSI